MTPRQPCPALPDPLEKYTEHFDDLFCHRAQRRSFRDYLQELLLPRERNKTLTALAGTEPGVGAQAAAVQQLQSFVSESTWAAAVNQRRLELFQADLRTTTHAMVTTKSRLAMASTVAWCPCSTLWPAP
jgi:SRSO17 transposase